jgi:hypothetical protein
MEIPMTSIKAVEGRLGDPSADRKSHGRDHGDRRGGDTRYIEVCWICADEWLAHVLAHPDEPHATVLIALRPPRPLHLLRHDTGTWWVVDRNDQDYDGPHNTKESAQECLGDLLEELRSAPHPSGA